MIKSIDILNPNENFYGQQLKSTQTEKFNDYIKNLESFKNDLIAKIKGLHDELKENLTKTNENLIKTNFTGFNSHAKNSEQKDKEFINTNPSVDKKPDVIANILELIDEKPIQE